VSINLREVFVSFLIEDSEILRQFDTLDSRTDELTTKLERLDDLFSNLGQESSSLFSNIRSIERMGAIDGPSINIDNSFEEAFDRVEERIKSIEGLENEIDISPFTERLDEINESFDRIVKSSNQLESTLEVSRENISEKDPFVVQTVRIADDALPLPVILSKDSVNDLNSLFSSLESTITDADLPEREISLSETNDLRNMSMAISNMEDALLDPSTIDTEFEADLKDLTETMEPLKVRTVPVISREDQVTPEDVSRLALGRLGGRAGGRLDSIISKGVDLAAERAGIDEEGVSTTLEGTALQGLLPDLSELSKVGESDTERRIREATKELELERQVPILTTTGEIGDIESIREERKEEARSRALDIATQLDLERQLKEGFDPTVLTPENIGAVKQLSEDLGLEDIVAGQKGGRFEELALKANERLAERLTEENVRFVESQIEGLELAEYPGLNNLIDKVDDLSQTIQNERENLPISKEEIVREIQTEVIKETADEPRLISPSVVIEQVNINNNADMNEFQDKIVESLTKVIDEEAKRRR
jgi:hypothetical protein